MKKFISKIFAIGAIVAPVITTLIMFKTEPEFVEALSGGIILGCLIGSIFGVLALLSNKQHSKWIKAVSVLPMIPTGVFAVLAIPYWLFG